jgi:type IV secretory pathway VirJ component
LYADGRANRTDAARGSRLAVVEVPATASGDRIALFMSGDGGWMVADRRLADTLAAHGVSVLGLDSRTYLTHRRTPEEVSRDVATMLNAYLSTWHKERLLLLGSSRGADLVPFVANRLPDELRDRVDLIAMFSMSRWVNFQFHWQDVLFHIRRPTDLPVLPELERLRGTHMLCVYGSSEKTSLCSAIDTSLVTPYPRDGSRRLRGDQSADLAHLILAELSP